MDALIEPRALVAELLARAAWHTAQEARYRTAIEVLELEQAGQTSATATSAPRAPRPGAPSTPVLIMEIVTEIPERAWRIADLLEVMTSRGWPSSSPWPDTVVRVAVARLQSQGILERVGRGLYRPVAGERP